jgi:hypothetical protein
MKKILLSSAALLFFAVASFAQEKKQALPVRLNKAKQTNSTRAQEKMQIENQNASGKKTTTRKVIVATTPKAEVIVPQEKR